MHIKKAFFPRWSLFLRLPLRIMKSEFHLIKILAVDPVMLRYRPIAMLEAKARFHIFRWGHDKSSRALCRPRLWGSNSFHTSSYCQTQHRSFAVLHFCLPPAPSEHHHLFAASLMRFYGKVYIPPSELSSQDAVLTLYSGPNLWAVRSPPPHIHTSGSGGGTRPTFPPALRLPPSKLDHLTLIKRV